MRRLKIVADAIGTEATLSQLLPYLATNIAMEDDEEDEILLILAEQLGLMVPELIPGYRALPLLPILERLAAVEETVVRDKAVESINKIVPVLLASPAGGDDNGDQQEAAAAAVNAAPALLLAMAKRLSGADWFTAKVSAAGILPVMYCFYNTHKKTGKANADGVGSSTDEAKRELRMLYKDLSEDDTPMVRRSAAKNLGKFVEAVANLPPSNGPPTKGEPSTPVPDTIKSMVTDEMVSVFQTLAQDEQDSVRLLAAAVAGSVGKALGRDPVLNAELIFPVIKSGCSDLSWRVRNNLAKEFAPVATSMGFGGPNGNKSCQTDLFNCFSGLLQDTEAEVRGAAVTNIARMTQLGGPELFNSHIAPNLPALSDDPVMEVRSRLAQTLMDCCDPTICDCLNDRIILQVFRPLLENFLTDEFAEVQLHILTKLSRVSNLLSKMDVVVSTVLQMTKAQNWRVREAVGHLLPHLADAMGVPFFEDHLLEPWLKLLLDQVADVRSACVTGMPKLLSAAGAQWIQSEMLPHYTKIYDGSSSYLTRITILRCFSALSECENLQANLLEAVLNQMIKSLNDRVANVRMVAARGLIELTKQCEEGVIVGKLRPALSQRVMEDEDEDCKYFAQLALDACN
jgi:serine/threonine-protein phosphatase 2A regulatory subunit A